MTRTRSKTFPLLLGAALICAALPLAVQAQVEHEHGDHEHEGLHFSHPLLNESPSPDTKFRLDFLWGRTGDGDERVTERGARLEGEFEFMEGMSVAVTVPWVRRESALGNVQGTGSTELSLKASSLRWGRQGVVVGGGLSVGLPTGSDEKAIGSSRSVELEPFADVGVQLGALELVAFGHYGATVHNPVGVEAEHELSLVGSVLYPVSRLAEVLMEVETVHPIGSDESATTRIAPGLKLYPFPNRHVMAGVSAPIALTRNGQPDSHEVIASIFYHF
ncbi:MAG TPA: hypothetical protein VFY85_08750 [Gemmatimonadaceae bacterium]|nr:hypothetical protein [Gemmatimonadaceae bacterium]